MALRDGQGKGLSARYGKTRFSRAGLFFGFRGGGCRRAMQAAFRRVPPRLREKGREAYRTLPMGGAGKPRRAREGGRILPLRKKKRSRDAPAGFFLQSDAAPEDAGRQKARKCCRRRSDTGGICRGGGTVGERLRRTSVPLQALRAPAVPRHGEGEGFAPAQGRRKRHGGSPSAAGRPLAGASCRGAEPWGNGEPGLFPRAGSGVFGAFSAAQAGSHEY